MLTTYNKISDLPVNIPVFPLAGILLLPRVELPLNIFEPRYLTMLNDVMAGDRVIGMIQPESAEDISVDPANKPELYLIGCAGRVTAYQELPDQRIGIVLTGLSRFYIKSELQTTTPYRQMAVNYDNFESDLVDPNNESDVDRDAVLETFSDYLDAHDLKIDWDEVESAGSELLVNSLCMMAPFPPAEKQALLEAQDLLTRADLLVAMTRMVLADNGSHNHLQ